MMMIRECGMAEFPRDEAVICITAGHDATAACLLTNTVELHLQVEFTKERLVLDSIYYDRHADRTFFDRCN
jgi:hypothetical protein